MIQIFVVSRSRDRLLNIRLQIIKGCPEFLVISDMFHSDCSLIGRTDRAYSQVRVRAGPGSLPGPALLCSALPPLSQISTTTR